MRKLRHLLFSGLPACLIAMLLVCAAGTVLVLRLPQAFAPIVVGERLFSLGVGIYVFLRTEETLRARRLLLILLLPWVGAIFCLFLCRKCGAARFGAPFGEGLTRQVSVIAAERPLACGRYFCRYFPTGQEFAASLLSDLEGAKERILLDYYILARGNFFDHVLSILEQKAREGVRVKLVFDGFGCAPNLPRDFPKQLRARGIAAEVFRRPSPFRLLSLNRRDHKKLALIDKTAYFGGINLADEYTGEKIRFGHWKDTAVRLSPAHYSEEKDGAISGKNEAICNGDVEATCVPFADTALPRQTRIGEEIFLRLIYAAEREIWFTTPYFAPTGRIRAALRSALRAGVRVRFMIPHIPDKKSVFALTRACTRELMREGAEAREYTAGFLHAKLFCADGRYSIVGSYNLDERSLRLSAENAVFLEGETFAKRLQQDFAALWETGTELKKPTFRECAAACFMRLLAPLV